MIVLRAIVALAVIVSAAAAAYEDRRARLAGAAVGGQAPYR